MNKFSLLGIILDFPLTAVVQSQSMDFTGGEGRIHERTPQVIK